jgi:predicted nucleotidyltransferase
MKREPLAHREIELIDGIFRHHPEITGVKLFGSRAKGTHSPSSDIDLAIFGNVSDHQAAELAAELDELPLPYHFDVLPFDLIQNPPLREHIERIGVTLYPRANNKISPSSVVESP